MTTEEILFLETDNSCAYCGIRKRENLTRHHIDGRDNNNSYDNQIVLCHCCHHRVHNNKGITQKEIKKIKKILIYKTLTQYGVNALKIGFRKNGKIIATPFLLCHLVDMGYMKQTDVHMWTGEVDILAVFELTDEGKELYRNWLIR